MSDKFRVSRETGKHHQLSKLTGNWEGIARTWFEPDKLGDESPVSGTMRTLLDGRFVLHEYKGSMGGSALEGMAILGYHLGLKQFQSAWIDSFHNGTAIMFSEGRRGAMELSVLGSYTYVSPEEEQVWGWRTTIDFINDDELVITSYNVAPGGEEAKATEIIYKRVSTS